jgi:hypothetical protein
MATALLLTACAAPQTKNTTAPQASGAANWSARYGEHYVRTWGVEIIGVRRVSSGSMLEFRYRVVDAEKAKALIEKSSKPYLFDEASGATLAVPALEKVGEVRQTAKPVVDRTYYMIFGNPSQIVKPGNRVSVVIGKFRVDGIIVQ